MPFFNIALIPKNPEQFIRYAHNLPYANKDTATYIISKHSIPHITLCHFEADQNAIENMWTEMTKQDFAEVSKLKLGIIHSSIYPKNNAANARYWTSLIPNKLSALKALHLDMAKIIKHPKNAAFDHYYPHMTLFNSNPQTSKVVEGSKVLAQPFEETFYLALGTLDQVGQIPTILHKIQAAF